MFVPLKRYEMSRRASDVHVKKPQPSDATRSSQKGYSKCETMSAGVGRSRGIRGYEMFEYKQEDIETVIECDLSKWAVSEIKRDRKREEMRDAR